jgi:glycosyltransferase involved in cell wall biosynthesis
MTSDVSVLIPAYGDSPYLIETLISISHNSVLPGEVLIIDDGLSGKALQDIHNFHGNFRPLVRKSNSKGLVEALNTGLKLAQFKFICRIDNDDLMMSKRIETQLKFFEGNAKTVAVGSQCIYIDSNGKETGLSRYFVGDISTSPKFSTQCLVAHPSTMYLRSAALSINGYRSIFNWNGTDIAEDFDFWLRLSRLGEIVVMDEFLTKYRQHPKQLSSLNSFGQSLGTPFISAVNKAKLDSQQCLYFSPTDISQRKYVTSLVRQFLGIKKRMALDLMFLQIQYPKITRMKAVRSILLKTIHLLER